MKRKTVLTIVILALLAVVIGSWLYFKHQDTTTGGNFTYNTQPDYSANRTLQETNNLVSIDFSKCTPDVRRFDVSFGSTTIEVKGKDKGSCLLNYGGEVENPNWDGKLDTSCRVPTDIGQRQFAKGDSGVDLSSISQYCSS